MLHLVLDTFVANRQTGFWQLVSHEFTPKHERSPSPAPLAYLYGKL
jgi:hypothetical protein